MYDKLWKILLKDPDYNDYAKLKEEFDWPRIKTAKRNQDIQNFFSKNRHTVSSSSRKAPSSKKRKTMEDEVISRPCTLSRPPHLTPLSPPICKDEDYADVGGAGPSGVKKPTAATTPAAKQTSNEYAKTYTKSKNRKALEE